MPVVNISNPSLDENLGGSDALSAENGKTTPLKLSEAFRARILRITEYYRLGIQREKLYLLKAENRFS